MIVLRKPWSGSSPATYPTYFPFIGAFLRARPQSDSIEQLAVPPRVRSVPVPCHSLRLYLTQRPLVRSGYVAAPGGVQQEGRAPVAALINAGLREAMVIPSRSGQDPDRRECMRCIHRPRSRPHQSFNYALFDDAET